MTDMLQGQVFSFLRQRCLLSFFNCVNLMFGDSVANFSLLWCLQVVLKSINMPLALCRHRSVEFRDSKGKDWQQYPFTSSGFLERSQARLSQRIAGTCRSQQERDEDLLERSICSVMERHLKFSSVALIDRSQLAKIKTNTQNSRSQRISVSAVIDWQQPTSENCAVAVGELGDC